MAKAPADLRSLARSHTALCVRVLGQIVSGRIGKAKVPPAVRVAAAVALMDRGWGKPEQSLEVIRTSIRQYSDADLLAIAADVSPRGLAPPKDQEVTH